jgi:nitrate/nitrite transporter NarK
MTFNRSTGVIYNPLGAWLHDRINSRRGMFITGLFGCLITTSGFAACIARYAGTDNKAGNAAGVFFVFLYLTFQGYVLDY